jgi:hypothetical protein
VNAPRIGDVVRRRERGGTTTAAIVYGILGDGTLELRVFRRDGAIRRIAHPGEWVPRGAAEPELVSRPMRLAALFVGSSCAPLCSPRAADERHPGRSGAQGRRTQPRRQLKWRRLSVS